MALGAVMSASNTIQRWAFVSHLGNSRNARLFRHPVGMIGTAADALDAICLIGIRLELCQWVAASSSGPDVVADPEWGVFTLRARQDGQGWMLREPGGSYETWYSDRVKAVSYAMQRSTWAVRLVRIYDTAGALWRVVLGCQYHAGYPPFSPKPVSSSS